MNDAPSKAQPVWREIDRQVIPNPSNPAPQEVLSKITSLEVTFRNFDGHTKTGVIEIHQDCKDDVLDFFQYAYALNFPIHDVVISSDDRFKWDDEKMMAANTSSGFNYRTKAGTDIPSWHGQGRAFDINTVQNPYIRMGPQDNLVVEPDQATWLIGAPGTLHAAHPLVLLMKSRGWDWGGGWRLEDPERKMIDYQHFEKPELFV